MTGREFYGRLDMNPDGINPHRPAHRRRRLPSDVPSSPSSLSPSPSQHNGQMKQLANPRSGKSRSIIIQSAHVNLFASGCGNIDGDEKKRKQDIQRDYRLSTTSRPSIDQRRRKNRKTRPRLIVQAFEDGQATALFATPVELPAKMCQRSLFSSLQGRHVVARL